MIDRAKLASFYDDAHTKAGWSAPWGAALEGLTPAQAAWKPGSERHSIWQIVNHVSFWREDMVRRNRGEDRATDEVATRENWREPDAPTEAAWKTTRERFAKSHEAIVRSLRETNWDLTSAMLVISHDYYHAGQIMLLRAMQGLKPIE